MLARLAAAAVLFSFIALSQEPPKAEYIGSETCAICHMDLSAAFQTTRHEALENEQKRGWAGRSCEACHGPGSIHAESTDVADIINPAKQPAVTENNNCLQCHRNQPARVGRILSGHAKDQVACSQCHRVHPGPGELLFETRKPQVNALCGQCHQSILASFQQPHSHPVASGAMACTDCHNPHNTVGYAHKRIAFGNEPACVNCHTRERGPFVFEHAPMRLEGCTACHQPHGSVNPRMLTRAEVRTVCLECHANLGVLSGSAGEPGAAIGAVPPAFHDINNPRYQSCTTCHRQIHGSFVDRSLQR
jgi:DmsE family decaheme c-type cytochrome